MKSFRCFVCGLPTTLKDARKVAGLTCRGCYALVAELPAVAQKLLSYVFRRLEGLEREIHGSKARRRVR